MERKRNVDVGRRIGRKIRQNEDAQAAASLDEQMYRIRIRGDGDKHVNEAHEKLEQARYKKTLDRIPCVPGQWTIELHEAVMQDLEEASVLARKGLELYQSVRASDKIEAAQQAGDAVEAEKYHSLRSKAAEELLEQSESSLLEGTNQGWPWGKEVFDEAETLVTRARDELALVHETGTDDVTMRPKPKEFHLKRQQWRVHTARRECQLKRATVQIQLERLRRDDSAMRISALQSLAEIGRIPVPMGVSFFGQLIPLEDEAAWRAGPGRGDVEVMEAIAATVDDPVWEVRKAVIAALPRAAAPDDARVVASTLRLVVDPIPWVRSAAMEAVVCHAPRGDPLVVAALVRRLHDTEGSLRQLAVRSLPSATALPADPFAVKQVLETIRISDGSGGERSSEAAGPQAAGAAQGAGERWLTEERDCLLASLQALGQIAPRGEEGAARVALAVLRVSLQRCLEEHTSPARDPRNPLRGSVDDVGESRGPVSLQAQLGALCSQPASSCVAQRGITSDCVRREAIALLRKVAVRAADIAKERARIRQVEEKLLGMEGEAKVEAARELERMRGRSYGALMGHVTVVEGLCASLLDFHRDVRWEAATAVTEIAELNDQVVVEGLAACLQSTEGGVRELAVKMLGGDACGRVMAAGCIEMTDALCGLLGSEVRETREAAAAGLRLHCEAGDRQAIFFLLQLLADDRPFAREMALQLLVELSPRGEQRVLQELDCCTRGVHGAVRMMAMYALVRISREGDASTKQRVEALLFDADEEVRCAATYAMAHICRRGDHLAVERLLGNCGDVAESVRRASIDALTRISPKGNPAVVEAALQLLEDPSEAVRRQALDTLGKVADKGDDAVCARMVARLSAEPAAGLETLAGLRELPWSPEKTVTFSRGSTAHSSAFWWSASDGITLQRSFRWQGGVPLTDSALLRASASGKLSSPAPFAPKTPVLDLPFPLRPRTADDLAPPPSAILFRIDSSLPARSAPRSVHPRSASPRSKASAATFAPYLVLDTDAGYDHAFGLLLLLRATLLPSLVTTIHGVAEAVAGAAVLKRLLSTLGHAALPVVPSSSSAVARALPSRPRRVLSSGLPGSSRGLASRGAGRGLLRPDGTARRISSRWGPDYRAQLARLGDHLSLAPLGVSHPELLRAPGLHLRLAAVQGDLRALSSKADVNTMELDAELSKVRQGLAALTEERATSFSQGFELAAPGPGAEEAEREVNPGQWPEVSAIAQAEQSRADVLRVDSPMGVRGSGGGQEAEGEAEAEEEECFHHNAAVAALLTELRGRGAGEVTLLCLGSLSNLDEALRHDAELVRERVKNVVIMGGAARVAPSSVGDHAFYKDGVEFNFYYDPSAAKNVLHSGLDVTMIGLEVANATVSTPELLQELASAQGSSLSAWILHQLVLMFDLAPAYASVASFYLIRPEAFETEQVWLDIDIHTGRTKEVDPGTESSVAVRMATSFDRASYREFLLQVIND